MLADLVNDDDDDRGRRNLIDNAVRYGGAASLMLTLKQEPGMAVIKIADKGPGLPEGQREAVVDPSCAKRGPAAATRAASAWVLPSTGPSFRGMAALYHLHNRREGGSEAVVALPNGSRLIDCPSILTKSGQRPG